MSIHTYKKLTDSEEMRTTTKGQLNQIIFVVLNQHIELNDEASLTKTRLVVTLFALILLHLHHSPTEGVLAQSAPMAPSILCFKAFKL